MQNKSLISHQELIAEIESRGEQAFLGYPDYVQFGQVMFGHSLGYEIEYTWCEIDRNGYELGSGAIPPLPTAKDVIDELLKQIKSNRGWL